MEHDYYEDIKSIIIDIRNELTFDESINKLNSFIEWALSVQRNELNKDIALQQLVYESCKVCDWLKYGSCTCPDGACPKMFILHKYLKPQNVGKIKCPSCDRFVYTLREGECLDCYENRKLHIDLPGRKIVKAIKRKYE